MNDMKGTPMPSPNDLPHERPTWSAGSFASASIEDTLRTVLRRVDPRKVTVDQLRDHLASAGVLASQEWVRSWLEEVNARGCR